MKTSLRADSLRKIAPSLKLAHGQFQGRYPGASGDRQPVHTYYMGAHEFQNDAARQLGGAGLASMDEYAPDFIAFAKAIGLRGSENLPKSEFQARALLKKIDRAAASDPEGVRRFHPSAWFAHTVYHRVREKIQREPIEDLRIDFEDGYGLRSDAEEDRDAEARAKDVASAILAGTLPPFTGIRIRPFTEELRERSVRTLDIFVSTLAAVAGAKFPNPFFVTLAKITVPEEVVALASICEDLEKSLGLAQNALRIELMIETTQAVINERGSANLLPLVEAAQGRCGGAHFGTYDYTAGRGITAAWQHMLHPACDFAREVMQVSLAGTGVWLSDGGTNILPIPPHGPARPGVDLTARQESENREAVHGAWKLHFDHIRHSLINGFYQGWDLHPAQLPTRYAAVFSFFLESMDAASSRLRAFLDRTALSPGGEAVADDAATGQGLLNYVLRAVHCGAVTREEARKLTSLTPEELRTASFTKILAGRRN